MLSKKHPLNYLAWIYRLGQIQNLRFFPLNKFEVSKGKDKQPDTASPKYLLSNFFKQEEK